jgi:hypothetical protein
LNFGSISLQFLSDFFSLECSLLYIILLVIFTLITLIFVKKLKFLIIKYFCVIKRHSVSGTRSKDVGFYNQSSLTYLVLSKFLHLHLLYFTFHIFYEVIFLVESRVTPHLAVIRATPPFSLTTGASTTLNCPY